VIAVSAALAACGGSDDSEPAARATPAVPTTQRIASPPRSPDAGITEGHAVADERRRRCRAEHSSRDWDDCARNSR
jgi:hypothetical protein